MADEQDRLLNDGTTYKDLRTRDNWTDVRDRLRKRAVEEFEKLVETVEQPESAEQFDAWVKAEDMVGSTQGKGA